MISPRSISYATRDESGYHDEARYIGLWQAGRVTEAGASHIYEVLAVSSNGHVHAFRARGTRPEAEDLLHESKR